MDPNNIVQSEEDKKAFEKKHGVHFDNTEVMIKKNGFEFKVMIGVWRKKEKFIAILGYDFNTSVRIEAKTYGKAIKKLIKAIR